MFLVKRRNLLGTFAAGVASGLSGCTEPISGLLDDEPDPREYVDDWQEDFHPAVGEPISVGTGEIDDTERHARRHGITLMRAILTERFPDANLNAQRRNGDIYALRFFNRTTKEPPGVSFDEFQSATPASITVTVEEGNEYRFNVYVGDSVGIERYD